VQIHDPLCALASVPAAAAVLLDVDGTLAPIVARPEDATVPDETRAELLRLHGRYGLVACISGRPGADAARVVGVPELTYVGEHGLELAPDATTWAGRIAAFADGIAAEAERKPLSVSFHYRGADDERSALRELELVAEHARAEGLVARWGRKVLEIRPPIDVDKGTAVRMLLERAGLRRALYAGDDSTDLDAFAGLAGLELGVRVAIVSPESPSELSTAADVTVASPRELLELLRGL
jgi:trehalose 6-phosphate phosphatase